MTLGAYQKVDAFAYPGWRLTVPGGPAGGHYKGFTHNYSAGTSIDPQDEYEWDRQAGVSAHDAVHASPSNPRGVYRSSGEVPPRPNASGSAHTYRGAQTRRHAGTSVAPGSFPVEFFETDEDAFLQRYSAEAALHGLGIIALPDGETFAYRRPVMPVIQRPNTVTAPTPMPSAMPAPPPPPPPPHSNIIVVGPMTNTPTAPTFNYGLPDAPPSVARILAPATGATSVVNQPAPTPVPLPPSPAVAAPTPPPVSPAPAPVVASPAVVPANDGSGNYVRVSDGSVLTPSQVYENPATGQLQAIPSASSGLTGWLTENSIWSAVPNWVLLAGAGVLVASMKGGRR